jgi:hypothetical protein
VTPVFAINFRREAFLREQARSRARLLALGGWLLYFGLLGVVVGLYGLNCGSLIRRVRQVERQAARLAAAPDAARGWSVDAAQLGAVETFHGSARFWRDKLARLSALMPPNVALTSISVNPGNLSGAAEKNKLVISGQLRAGPGQAPMGAVVQLVNVLQRDTVFASGYQTIKLAQSRTTDAHPPVTEFVIECR